MNVHRFRARAALAALTAPTAPQFAAAVAGLVAFAIVWYFASPQWWIGSHVEVFWDRAGDAFRDGGEVYWRAADWESFYYAPPIALVFALVTWLPVSVQYGAIVALDIAALRVITGSWWGAAAFAGFPLVPFEVAGGHLNLLLGAAIVLAVRGGPVWPLALAAWTKLSPVLADPRRVIVPLVLLALVTVPWWHRWIEWGSLLLAAYGQPVGPQLPIPLPIRVLVGFGFLALRRPWAHAAAAIICLPAMYWQSLVLVPVPVIVWLRDREAARSIPVQEPSALAVP